MPKPRLTLKTAPSFPSEWRVLSEMQRYRKLFESRKGKAFQDLGRGSDFMFTWPGSQRISEPPKISPRLVPSAPHAHTCTIRTSAHVAARRVNEGCAARPDVRPREPPTQRHGRARPRRRSRRRAPACCRGAAVPRTPAAVPAGDFSVRPCPQPTRAASARMVNEAGRGAERLGTCAKSRAKLG